MKTLRTLLEVRKFPYTKPEHRDVRAVTARLRKRGYAKDPEVLKNKDVTQPGKQYGHLYRNKEGHRIGVLSGGRTGGGVFAVRRVRDPKSRDDPSDPS